MKAMPFYQSWTRFWHDAPRHRFVIRRRAGKVERGTCVRYGIKWSRDVARHRALYIACRLRRCAVHNLKQFRFTP